MMAFEMFDTSHESLVDLGAKIAVGMGYTKVIKEYSISIPTCFQKKTGQTQYRVDVFAENDKGETLAIECGHLHSVYGKDGGYNKLVTLHVMFNHVMWLPYFSEKEFIPENVEDMLLDMEHLTEKRNELEKEINGMQDTILGLSTLIKEYEIFNERITNIKNVLLSEDDIKYLKCRLDSLLRPAH